MPMEVIPDMPVALLDERGKELSGLLREIRPENMDPKRRADIQKELGVIAFELLMQYNEGKMEIVET